MLRGVRPREETEGEGWGGESHEVYQPSLGPAFYLLEGCNKEAQEPQQPAARSLNSSASGGSAGH